MQGPLLLIAHRRTSGFDIAPQRTARQNGFTAKLGLGATQLCLAGRLATRCRFAALIEEPDRLESSEVVVLVQAEAAIVRLVPPPSGSDQA